MQYFEFDRIQSHSDEIHENHSDFNFIMNVHNPYKRLVSIFNLIKKDEKYSTLKFENWIRRNVEESDKFNSNPNQLWLSKIFLGFDHKPNYIVKVENLYKDLMKIEFIKKNFTEKLQIIFLENIITNSYRESDVDYWKKEYNKDLSKFVFEKFQTDFEIFNYDKDSWN